MKAANEFKKVTEEMSTQRREQLMVWEDPKEEEEALEADYQSLMGWWKQNPSPELLLIHEMLEMVTKAKFWVWYLNDKGQDKRILDMKGFLQHDVFYNEEEN